ncbi:FtsB family cell division protein [Vagococcus intermedius]|uniref:Septum formation initiator family protein n=1 Tax=Vagococcus intermedius TaxID=2991418 RepID=A0AAF0CUS6_9ENTE|nr:septum formation initiator family protein [Vagococcus intermedius]WEG73266.1 septum formation initiator family protein [Vagococcus intermedius]WEG75348.1 septum formation initiator family protein [Vagococcus intermedius]
MVEKNVKRQTNSNEAKVSSIGNHYTEEQLKKYNREKKELIFKRRRLAALFTVITVVFLASGFNIIRSYLHISDLKQEKVAAKQEDANLKQQLSSLKYDVKLLEDEDYLLKVARQKYFYTKEDELVYSLPQIKEKPQNHQLNQIDKSGKNE